MRCNNNDFTWKYINNGRGGAYVPAITVCLQKLVYIPPVAKHGDLSVAILGVNPDISDHWIEEVADKIYKVGFFNKVDIFDASIVTPTLNQLLEYDSIMVYSDGYFLDGEALGDIVADYSDTGRGVVVAVFETAVPSLLGRWAEQVYDPIDPVDQAEDTELTLVLPGEIPDHQVLNNVHSFDGGSSSYYGTGDLNSDSVIVAKWSNDAIFIAEKTNKSGKILALNFYPPSNDSRVDFWKSYTDGDIIMANALKYCAT